MISNLQRLFAFIALTLVITVFNLVWTGLALAFAIIAWLAYLAWQSRNDPHDPSLY